MNSEAHPIEHSPDEALAEMRRPHQPTLAFVSACDFSDRRMSDRSSHRPSPDDYPRHQMPPKALARDLSGGLCAIVAETLWAREWKIGWGSGDRLLRNGRNKDVVETGGKCVICCGFPLSLITSLINPREQQALALEGCTFHTYLPSYLIRQFWSHD